MRKSVMGLLASGLVIACGCTQGTPGGPGVKTQPTTQSQTTYKPTVDDSRKPVVDDSRAPVVDNARKPVVDDSRETFTLRTPVLSTSLKQGETKSASITISRGKDFQDDVNLTFSGIPAGVTFDPATATLKHGDKEQKINISASDDAALGDFTIKVLGHPSSGPDATNEFKLNISAK